MLGDLVDDDVDMAEPDFDFKPASSQSQERDMERILNRLEQSAILEASHSSQEYSSQQDNQGNYKYYDSAEEDYYEKENNSEDEGEEESKHDRQQRIMNRTQTGQDQVNRETLQAQSYDRTFILSGPIIKVYRQDDSINGNLANIVHVTDMPPIFSSTDSVTPVNLLLHDNEGQLVFKNERDPSQIFIYDLETGKVVQELDTGGDIKFTHINNDIKNG